MVSLASLWLPILLSSALVFVASFVVHMVLTYHRSDIARLPGEDDIRAAFQKSSVAPGDYMTPYAGSPEGMKSPEFIEKVTKGPVAIVTVMQSGGPPSINKNLAQWLVYCIVVSVFAAYVTSRAVPAGAPYLSAFRMAATTAFVGYALAQWQNSIWGGRKWSTTIKNTFDGLVYGLLTGGAFGWLWP